MLVATAAVLVLSPLIIVIAVAFDLARGKRRLPTLRLHAFVCQYAINDSVEILAAGPLWLAAGFGSRLDGPASQRRHERLQAWSIALLARRAQQLLGLTIELEPGVASALAPGPAIVLCRHVNLFDPLVPSLLYQQLGMHTRGVIMAELLADPGFDLLYQRAGSVFIPRDSDPAARTLTASAARSLDVRTVAVIFPEGRLFREDALERALARIADRTPERSPRLAGLRHVLPPRPAGVLSLLDAAPQADVVVINHVGFDQFPGIASFVRDVPLDWSVRVAATRIPRDQVPRGEAERTEWLDRLWCDVDEWIDRQLSGPPGMLSHGGT